MWLFAVWLSLLMIKIKNKLWKQLMNQYSLGMLVVKCELS